MNKSFLVIAGLLAALGGAAQAQQSAASTDPIVQLRAEEKAARKAYDDKKQALDKPRNAQIKAAGDKAAADAQAKGGDALVARRDAEAKVRSQTKAEHDAKLEVLKKERDDALAGIRKKYPAKS